MSATSRRWSMLGAAIVAEVTATLSLKAALHAPWLYVVVVVGYLLAFYLLSRVLKAGMGLGVAYGIWGAAGVVLTAALSTVLFREPLTWLMALGFAVIIGGVLCIELGSQAANRHHEHETRAMGGDTHPDAPGDVHDSPTGEVT